MLEVEVHVENDTFHGDRHETLARALVKRGQ